MGIFGGGEVIDLTLLKKRGILKIKESPPDVLDMTQQPLQSPSVPSVSVPQSSPFDMLSSLASSASTNNESSFSNLQTNNEPNLELSHVKVKMEDVEYKMERLIERIAKLEDRLIEFERNASRSI